MGVHVSSDRHLLRLLLGLELRVSTNNEYMFKAEQISVEVCLAA